MQYNNPTKKEGGKLKQKDKLKKHTLK